MVLVKRPRVAACFTMLAIVVALNVVVDATWLSKPTVIIDFNGISYPASTRATGFLFGLQNGTPADPLITSLLPRTYRFNQWVDTWDRVNDLNHQLPVQIRPVVLLSDRYGFPPGYGGRLRPGAGGNWSAWEALVAGDVARNLAAGRNGSNIFYDIWNEPDFQQFWDGTFDQFCETWYRGAGIIRALDPTAMLVGPSLAFFNLSNFQLFLDYIDGKNASLIPDVLTWHEVNDQPWNIEPRVQALRAMLAATGYASRIDQVHLHEYGWDTTLLCPGPNLHTIAAVDRAGLDGATRAIINARGWSDDTMDNLLTPGLEPTVIWHVYKAYADMARANATMYTVTRTTAIVDGLASIDGGNVIRCLLGTNESASMRVNVQLANVPGAALFPRYRLRVNNLPDIGETPYPDSNLVQERAITMQGAILEFSTTIEGRGAISVTLEPI